MMKKVQSVKEIKKICSVKYTTPDYLCQFFLRPLSFYLTKPLLYTPITANQVSFLSIILVVPAFFLIASGDYWMTLWGAIILNLTSLLDCIDGAIAKCKKCFTLMGQYSECVYHEIVPAPILLALGINAYHHLNNPLFIIMAALSVYFVFLIITLGSAKLRVLFARSVKEGRLLVKNIEDRKTKTLNKTKLQKLVVYFIHFFNNPGQFFTFILIFAIFDLVYYLVVFYFVFYLINALIKIILELRSAFKDFE